MKKCVKIVFMEQLYLKILISKYFKWPVIIITVIFTSIIVYFSCIKDEIIFPDTDHYICDYYSDKPNDGNSKILNHTVSDSLIKLSFLLQDKFHSPYVGVSIAPLKNKIINAQKYNQISLTILGENIDRIGLSIFTSPFTSINKNEQDESLYHTYLNISTQLKTYDIPIKQLHHPDWWEDLHHLQENERDEPNLDNILHINIGSAFSPYIKNVKTLKIYSLSFSRNNQMLFVSMALVYTILVLLNFAILYIILNRKNKDTKITVAYKSLEITNNISGEEPCIEYINSNYSDSNLTLEIISEKISVTQRKITKIIRDKFECNFKTYLNRIRINESKRFLTQSNLNIGEIACKVGFNSQSHFNRVFKTEMQLSPSKYRETHIA